VKNRHHINRKVLYHAHIANSCISFLSSMTEILTIIFWVMIVPHKINHQLHELIIHSLNSFHWSFVVTSSLSRNSFQVCLHVSFFCFSLVLLLTICSYYSSTIFSFWNGLFVHLLKTRFSSIIFLYFSRNSSFVNINAFSLAFEFLKNFITLFCTFSLLFSFRSR
jgi:hypothetical protein